MSFSIKVFLFFPILLLVACATYENSIESLFCDIERYARTLPDKKNDSAVVVLEKKLEEILSHSHFPWISEEKTVFLLDAIENYQLGYYMHPTRERWEKLQKFYLIFEQKITTTQKARYQEFYKLKGMIAQIKVRSDRAEDSIPSLLGYWNKNPQDISDFLIQIQQRWEMGGILLKKSENWEMLCLEDQEKNRTRQYIEEFKRNEFRNLNILEEKFLNRLELRKTGADHYTIAYSNVIIPKAKEKFALIRALAKKNALDEKEADLLEKAKKKLYFFGLEKMLLRHSYFLDASQYMANPELVFFFHTHPHDPRIFYKKPPSGQDLAMSLRIGPMLVFDMQKDCIDVYAVVFGKSEKIKTF